MRFNDIREGYKMLPPVDKERYGKRPGLDGPLRARNGKVLYYDPQEGKYYDPETDFYLTYDEFAAMDRDPDIQEDNLSERGKGAVSVLSLPPAHDDDEVYQRLQVLKRAGITAMSGARNAATDILVPAKDIHVAQRLLGGKVFETMTAGAMGAGAVASVAQPIGKMQRRNKKKHTKTNEAGDNFDKHPLDVYTPRVQELAKKYGVSVKDVMAEVKKGVEIEFEHTSDYDTAMEIALDHLGEKLDYYDRLASVEEGENLNHYDLRRGEKPKSGMWQGVTVTLDDGSKATVLDAERDGSGMVLRVRPEGGQGHQYVSTVGTSFYEAVEKIACLKCDEVSTRKAWKENDNFCPKCDSSQNGVKVSEGKDKPEAVKHNPVAKNMNKFNKAATHTDKKKASKKGYKKHKGSLDEDFHTDTNPAVLGQLHGNMYSDGEKSRHKDIACPYEKGTEEYARYQKGWDLGNEGVSWLFDPIQEGSLRQTLGVIAVLAALWGVENNLAQQAYDNSPQLQQLLKFHQHAEAIGDENAVARLEARIEAHKDRLDRGGGEVMGADGNPKKVTYERMTRK